MNISKFHLITSLSLILFFYLLWASAFHWNLLLRLHLCKLIKRFCTGEFYCPIGPSSLSEVFSSFSFFFSLVFCCLYCIRLKTICQVFFLFIFIFFMYYLNILFILFDFYLLFNLLPHNETVLLFQRNFLGIHPVDGNKLIVI